MTKQIDGIRIVDAKKKLKLEIKPCDVNHGKTKDPGTCAAAQACMRQLKATRARVHLSRVFVNVKDKWVRYETPPSLRNEIIAFDRGGKFMPGEFVLIAPRPSFRTGSKRKSSKTGTHPQRGHRLKKPHRLVAGVRERFNADT